MEIKLETFIDVRTDDEWNAGHLDDALHFELARMEQGQMPELEKNTAIAVYCRRGIRAERALQILKKNGFTNIRNAGGYDDLK
jgi:phage shock protein E